MNFAYWLTPRSRVLLEKLNVSHLVKKFHAFYVVRRFITAVISARYLSLSWASSIHSTPPYPISWRSILISSSHLRLDIPSGLYSSDFATETLYKHPLFPYELHAPPISFFSILVTDKFWVRSTDHDAPHYVVFSSVSPRPS